MPVILKGERPDITDIAKALVPVNAVWNEARIHGAVGVQARQLHPHEPTDLPEGTANEDATVRLKCNVVYWIVDV